MHIFFIKHFNVETHFFVETEKKVPHFIPFRRATVKCNCQVINSIYLSLKRGTADTNARIDVASKYRSLELCESRRTGCGICKSFESSTVTIAVSRSVLDDEKTRNSLLATPSYRRCLRNFSRDAIKHFTIYRYRFSLSHKFYNNTEKSPKIS